MFTETPTNSLFEALREDDEIKFKKLLNISDPNAKYEGIPLLHFVVRSAGPKHLYALIESGVNVNILSEQNMPASALQWITGMMYPNGFCWGWPRNYESRENHITSIGIDGSRELDGFIGTAHAIMIDISTMLISQGATIDFYSACALGYLDSVKKHLAGNPDLLFIPGPDGASALAWAARRAQNQVISLLLELGADVNQHNSESYLTPLEEAVLFHGTKETLTLLLAKGAWPRRGIIGACGKNRIEIIDYLLSCVSNPSDLIEAGDIKAIQSTTNYLNILNVFAKHHISLAKIEKEITSSGLERPLIFDGCTKSIDLLRLLISMGCNINASFPRQFVAGQDRENNKLNEASPLCFLFLHLQTKTTEKEKLKLLNKMALLFLNGSEVSPAHAHQPHPINDLCAIDLISFLIFIYDEIKQSQINRTEAFSKLSRDSISLLEDKIEQALIVTRDSGIRGKLEYLGSCCRFPSLMTLCIRTLTKYNLFNETQKSIVPDELAEQLTIS
ncbi:ankyrin repeat domain-containing protein [Legionella sp. 16cNR16C]|uniref:ankyrin repeat domain-containing protein n=1 Tax=Legionella sp. 16cNR16C TaxID=2905656 RepID=UPI001E5CEC18|nr:ankyrin repeat domain-containing protein [Legionella sp. 16cNR16C]MCE3043885.1 ankyrin repeat domain-containing protein [Legionella sp. 16cNR16C]